MSKFESHDQMAGGVSDRVDFDQEYRMEGHKQTLLSINNEDLTEVRSCSIALCEIIAIKQICLLVRKAGTDHTLARRGTAKCVSWQLVAQACTLLVPSPRVACG